MGPGTDGMLIQRCGAGALVSSTHMSAAKADATAALTWRLERVESHLKDDTTSVPLENRVSALLDTIAAASAHHSSLRHLILHGSSWASQQKVNWASSRRRHQRQCR